MNPFKVLDLPVTASKDQIRSAYRTLARRWHPDRFMEGPERDWANEKMAEINAAYHACLRGQRQPADPEEDKRTLGRIEEMIRSGHYQSARRMLMDITTRCAEWNYLFGAVLFKMCENEKALIYLGVAARQQPENVKYAKAFREAQEARQGMRSRLTAFIKGRMK